jgi:PAS domain S-box-containing protein
MLICRAFGALSQPAEEILLMISASTALPGSYDYSEVARSVFIAIVASYAALDLAGRVTAARGRIRLAWLSGGAIAMGIGIWTMHFKGMLAFHLAVPVEYHWPTVLASLLVAILASASALYVASRQKMGPVEVLTGSVILGGGLAGMHYIGMAAMRMPAITHFSPVLVTCSILLAILFSAITLRLAFSLREETRWSGPRRLGGATVIGVAVSAIHYIGLAAASFTTASPPHLFHAVSISPLADNGIAIVTLIVLVAAIMTSSVDRRANAEVQRLNRDLERRVAKRTLELEAVNQALRKEIAERERAEESVRRSEDRLRLVIDTIPQEISIGPPDGSLDFCNVQWRSYTGLTQEEAQGDGWQRVLHPDDRERVTKAWRESVANGTPYEQEARRRGADGQYRCFLARSVPLRDSEGRIIRWYGTNTDIEDRKEAEGRLRLVIDTIPQQIWSGTPNGSLYFFNAQWLSYTGLTQEEAQGDGWQRILHPDDRARVLKAWRESVVNGTSYEQEARRRGADGQYRWFLARGVPLRDSKGRIVRWYGTNTDIEDRKRAEDELSKQKGIFQKIFEDIPVMVAFTGKDGHLELINPEWERTIGWTLAEIREQNLDIYAELFPDPQYRQMVLDVVAASTGEWTDLKVRVRDGRVIDMAAALVHLSDGSSLGIGKDITEWRRAQAALQEAQANLARVTRVVAMGELAAAIAHEVNQPLTAIVTNANFCLRRLDGTTLKPDELRAAIKAIANDGTRASGVISRIHSLLKKGTPERTELEINQIIQDVTTLLRHEFSRSRVSLRTELASDLPRVPGDPVQLQQVLINLIMNAVEATSSSTNGRRTILIRSAKNPDGVLVQVQDSGPGIAPELGDRIFEPFFTTKAEGIGMGLSISRSILESHGGQLSFLPTFQGALFQFVLPVDQSEAA